ncbi:hypothetical protein CXG81DRAFT_26914 [Caulochytrium protostelioides]|uniref:MICOS complex subunit MIC12 n=1 Tax=Caulochytrium protostelioides TaxID=1555241 RepID=A0A4P9WW95_9FUNG|nr:hypothetical protein CAUPRSCDRAFT_11343 [Caulochytrium protostelioides]RKP00385.1 hypothetical protein CXG81DRAFT_26914 [Caulochytrium protostelioides]|eukprot:RKP00385.1 hypothetical protein CXG81DRAFT_26914 [Caulochytrium protostelioides]
MVRFLVPFAAGALTVGLGVQALRSEAGQGSSFLINQLHTASGQLSAAASGTAAPEAPKSMQLRPVSFGLATDWTRWRHHLGERWAYKRAQMARNWNSILAAIASRITGSF